MEPIKEKKPQNKNIKTQLKNVWHIKIKSLVATFVTAIFIIVIERFINIFFSKLN